MNSITLDELDALDLTGATMTEKYDGIQGCWDGQRLTTRNGTPLNPPQWWLDLMPKTAAIGELWLGPGTTDADACALFGKDGPWDQCRFQIFHGEKTGHWLPIQTEWAYSADRVREFYNHVIGQTGEGIVLKTMSGTHKIKPIQDAEAEIIGATEGKYPGTIAALICRVVGGEMDGMEIKLSAGLRASERELRTMPAIGSLAKFAYSGRTKSGQPKCAIFLGIRDPRTLSFSAKL